MKKNVVLYFIIVLIILSFLIFIHNLDLKENIQLEYHNVTRIIDGDTFEIDTKEKVRMVCINTPEIGEEGAKEATEYLRLLVEDKKVGLEKDISETDRYRRLLRYVYVEYNNELLFVNKELVSKGHAKIFRYGQDTKRCNEIEG